MKVVVPIKRVPEQGARPSPTGDGSAVEESGLKFEINYFDEVALAAAARLKESGAATEIVAVTIGGGEAEEQLRKALAIAADRAVLLETNDPLDASSVAALLADFVREAAADLVLMGKQTTDGDGNQVAQRLAAALDWPQATFAARIEIVGSGLAVTRETDDGEETLSMPLPAVVSADLRLTELRYVSLPGIIKARSKPLERRPATPSAPKLRTVKVRLPATREPGRKVASADELFDILVARGAL